MNHQSLFMVGTEIETPILHDRERALVELALSICKNDSLSRFQSYAEAALANGCTGRDLKELILQLSIYTGFPKTLQSLKRLKTLATFNTSPDSPTYPSSQFNFFECADVQQALLEVDPEFADLALMNAIPLNRRSGLAAKERALAILATDIFHQAFEGPFQIHVQMALRCGASETDIHALIQTAEGQLEASSILLARRHLTFPREK